MKISLVQYSPEWEAKDKNIQKLSSMLNNIPHTDLIVFPEMTLTAFTMRSTEMAEYFYGNSVKYFTSVAKEKHCNVIFGFIEKGKKKNFNTLVHLNEKGKIRSTYRKIHPFSYSTEDKNYGKGKEIVISKVMGWKTGLSICYDLRFPELYRKYGKKRTELIVNIANWPDTRIEHWRTLLKARAIENQCYVAGVNRVGNDPKLHYNGFSSVFDPMGKELISLANEENILEVELNKELVKETQKKFPFLDDIRMI